MPPPIYLDHATTSWPKTPGVGDAMADAVSHLIATPARGSHSPSIAAGELATHLRDRLAVFIGITDPARIILTSGATESLNIALLGTLAHRTDRPRVVTTTTEHNAVRRPLEHLAAKRVIELVRVESNTNALVDADAVIRAIDDRTAVVAVNHASNVCGTIQPVRQIAAELQSRRARTRPTPLFLLDASQTAGLLALDAELLGIDLLAFSGHKALRGPAGTGVLYIGPHAFHTTSQSPNSQPLRPISFGGTGHDSESTDMPAQLPARFEPGTPNLPGIAGLLAAVKLCSPHSAAAALSHGRALVSQLRIALAPIRGIRFQGPHETNTHLPVLSFTIANISPDEAAAALEQAGGLIVRAGLHCAPWTHASLGTLALGGTIRLSPGPETTPAQIASAIDVISRLARAVAG